MPDAIRRAGSIGELEALAGIGRSHAERLTFWLSFAALPGARALDAGVAELRRRALDRARPRYGRSPTLTHIRRRRREGASHANTSA